MIKSALEISFSKDWNKKHRKDEGLDWFCPSLPPLRSRSDDEVVRVQEASHIGEPKQWG
jgi:hypothetical protein